MPVQPTSAARQRRCSGRGVFNHPRPTPEPPSLDRGYGPPFPAAMTLTLFARSWKTYALTVLTVPNAIDRWSSDGWA